MNKKEVLILGGSIFFLVYTLFWIKVLPSQKKQVQQVLPASTSIITPTIIPTFDPQDVQISLAPTPEVLPDSVSIPLPTRAQAFGLSCEFAAASSILYFYTKNLQFAPNNELNAEKALISQMNVSNNPNIGIRMGKDTPQDTKTLYDNLNKRFGGTENYGIHAPPFIDFFSLYGLSARPLAGQADVQSEIKKAIYQNHLVMTWIRLGAAQVVNIPLAYGEVPVVPGEHVVVIDGYDANGVYIMDPGIGRERQISFADLLNQTKDFPMPFLEVSKTSNSYFSIDTIVPFAQSLGLDRKNLRIQIINASGVTGKGNDIAQTLMDFGYTVTGLITQTDETKENVSIVLRKEKSDYLNLLKKDLSLSLYPASITLNSTIADPTIDAIVTVGN